MNTNLAYFATISLVDASLEKFRTMPTINGTVERRNLEFVIGVPAADRLQIVPTYTNNRQIKYEKGRKKNHGRIDHSITVHNVHCIVSTHIASCSAFIHLLRSASVFMYNVNAVACVLRASNNWNLKRASRPSVRRVWHGSTRYSAKLCDSRNEYCPLSPIFVFFTRIMIRSKMNAYRCLVFWSSCALIFRSPSSSRRPYWVRSLPLGRFKSTMLSYEFKQQQKSNAFQLTNMVVSSYLCAMTYSDFLYNH